MFKTGEAPMQINTATREEFGCKSRTREQAKNNLNANHVLFLMQPINWPAIVAWTWTTNGVGECNFPVGNENWHFREMGTVKENIFLYWKLCSEMCHKCVTQITYRMVHSNSDIEQPEMHFPCRVIEHLKRFKKENFNAQAKLFDGN